MIIPKLKKIKSEKKYHDILLEDEYAWVDQPNILEVLKDANKLDPEVKDYISANNKITEEYFDDTKELQKSLFTEIKSKIGRSAGRPTHHRSSGINRPDCSRGRSDGSMVEEG